MARKRQCGKKQGLMIKSRHGGVGTVVRCTLEHGHEGAHGRTVTDWSGDQKVLLRWEVAE